MNSTDPRQNSDGSPELAPAPLLGQPIICSTRRVNSDRIYLQLEHHFGIALSNRDARDMASALLMALVQGDQRSQAEELAFRDHLNKRRKDNGSGDTPCQSESSAVHPPDLRVASEIQSKSPSPHHSNVVNLFRVIAWQDCWPNAPDEPRRADDERQPVTSRQTRGAARR